MTVFHPFPEKRREVPGTRLAAGATIRIENARMRATGWHVHPTDCVVIPMATGEPGLETRDGVVVNALRVGVSHGRVAGSEHNVFHDTESEFVFVDIELT